MSSTGEAATTREEKVANIQQLLSSVSDSLAEQRRMQDEWTRLEQTNLSLRQSLHGYLLRAHEAHKLSLGVGESQANMDGQSLLHTTTSYLASSSAILRQQLFQIWKERQQVQISCSGSDESSNGGLNYNFTRDQQNQLNWILQTLPNIDPNQSSSLSSSNSSSKPKPSPAAAPVPIVSHQPPFCSLDYPIDKISREWSTVFPAELLATDGEGHRSQAEITAWENRIEEVWDAIQNNRALYEEWNMHANTKPNPSTTSSIAASSTPSAAVAAANGDSVMMHAMENYGFPIPQAGQPQVIYEFDEADSPDNIVMESDGNNVSAGNTGGGSSGSNTSASTRTIKCATLNKLIERVTHEKYVDLNTRYVFLLTYHSFTTPRELLAKLSSRFHVPLPPNLTPSELSYFKSNKLDRIQIRVCSVLKAWLDEHWNDFVDDSALKQGLETLISQMQASSGSPLTTQLAKALSALYRKKEKASAAAKEAEEKAAQGANGVVNSYLILNQRLASSTNAKPPKVIVPSRLTLENFDLLALDEIELARQLTLMDFDKFRRIQPRECLNQNWSKPSTKAVLAPNILGMITQFNKVSLWVESLILHEKDLKARIKLYEKCIKIAEQCRLLNNFNSVFAIYCGLSSNPIHRLRKTKEGISAKYGKKFDELKELFRGDKNSRNFRRVLQQSLTPCIPHLGIFLSDLTFTEDGNPDQLLNMINFQKRCKLAERIRWIKQYQQEGYLLEVVPVIQQYLHNQFKQEFDAEVLWKMSKEIEPSEPR